jgi:branched-chain amino acid transport system permease protein
MLFAFEAVILGGLGSIWGTLAGGIILGIAQAAGTFIVPSLGPLVGHIVFLIGLLLMPGGLFTKRIRA